MLTIAFSCSVSSRIWHSFAHFFQCKPVFSSFHQVGGSSALLCVSVCNLTCYCRISQVWQTGRSCCRRCILLCNRSPEPSCETLVCTELLCAEWKYHLKPHTALRNKPWGKSSVLTVNSSTNGPWPRLPNTSSKETMPGLSCATLPGLPVSNH